MNKARYLLWALALLSLQLSTLAWAGRADDGSDSDSEQEFSDAVPYEGKVGILKKSPRSTTPPSSASLPVTPMDLAPFKDLLDNIQTQLPASGKKTKAIRKTADFAIKKIQVLEKTYSKKPIPKFNTDYLTLVDYLDLIYNNPSLNGAVPGTSIERSFSSFKDSYNKYLAIRSQRLQFAKKSAFPVRTVAAFARDAKIILEELHKKNSKDYFQFRRALSYLEKTQLTIDRRGLQYVAEDDPSLLDTINRIKIIQKTANFQSQITPEQNEDFNASMDVLLNSHQSIEVETPNSGNSAAAPEEAVSDQNKKSVFFSMPLVEYSDDPKKPAAQTGK